MYKHLVLWKLKETANGKSKSQNAELVKNKIEGLNNSIPEIAALSVGVNIGDYGASFFDVGMDVSFVDKADFLKYITYKSHDEVVAFIQSVMEAEEIVDFTTGIKGK